jgi:hypothetical protein
LYIWEVSSFALFDPQLFGCRLDPTSKGDNRVVGDANDLIPIQFAALACPRTIAQHARPETSPAATV